jgi:hypothetical protein
MGMSLKYGLLIFFLLCTALSLALKNYEVWTQPMESIHENKEPTKSDNKPEPGMISNKGIDSSAVNSYASIFQRNIFSPERKEFSTTPDGQPKLTVRPQIILHGVTIAPDYQSASVVNPGRPFMASGTKTVKIGDRV